MRKKIIAANWKMNQTVADAATYLDNFLIEVADETLLEEYDAYYYDRAGELPLPVDA